MKKHLIKACLIALLSQSATNYADMPSGNEIMVIVNQQKGQFSLPPLPFQISDLEPYIDARTVDIHYNRHHRAYVDGLNKAITGTQWENMSLEELFANAKSLPENIRNNAGGHWGHSFYWSIMTSPRKNMKMSDRMQKQLEKDFGSVENFKEMFRKAGLTRFGSGWAWLIKDANGNFKICSSPNQDNPLMNFAPVQGTPILTCDVWEHAYYLKYLNRRDNYMDAFWNVVNWDRVDELAFGKTS